MNWRVRADYLRALPLPFVLAASEATPDPSDPAKWRTARDVFSVTGAKYINWNQSVGGGGGIDLVMHVRQVGFGRALQWLEERFGAPALAQPASLFTTRPCTLPPPAAHHWPRIERYLIENRKLARSLLTLLARAGILYADARANAVFLLGDTLATAVGAELRGTRLCQGLGEQATSQSWRGMAPGSRKDRGFFSVPAVSPQAIVLCESAIEPSVATFFIRPIDAFPLPAPDLPQPGSASCSAWVCPSSAASRLIPPATPWPNG